MFVTNWDKFFDDLTSSSITAKPLEDEASLIKSSYVYVKLPIVPPTTQQGNILAYSNADETVNSASKTYLTFTIPPPPSNKKLQALVFTLESRDQGWSNFPKDYNSFRGSWSWFDVELWREAKQQEDVPKTRDIHLAGDSWEQDHRKIIWDGTKYMVGSWLLQRNRHALSVYQEYEVTWDADTDELPDDHPDKWEGGLSEQGEKSDRIGVREKWYKNGRSHNGQFIRNIKTGDELRVVMKARYAGWACTAKKCEVRAIWK